MVRTAKHAFSVPIHPMCLTHLLRRSRVFHIRVDGRSNWHIINHAYRKDQFTQCSTKAISSHMFSEDGKNWTALPDFVQPYGSNVTFNDNGTLSWKVFSTLERPNIFFDTQSGRMTYITNAADGERTECPPTQCDNCKWNDTADTIIRRFATS